MQVTFGIMANKWRIFHKAINVNVQFAENIIKACCIFHNYVRTRDGYKYEDALFRAPLENLNTVSIPRGNMSAKSVRDQFADYFIGEGKVDWQDRMI